MTTIKFPVVASNGDAPRSDYVYTLVAAAISNGLISSYDEVTDAEIEFEPVRPTAVSLGKMLPTEIFAFKAATIIGEVGNARLEEIRDNFLKQNPKYKAFSAEQLSRLGFAIENVKDAESLAKCDVIANALEMYAFTSVRIRTESWLGVLQVGDGYEVYFA